MELIKQLVMGMVMGHGELFQIILAWYGIPHETQSHTYINAPINLHFNIIMPPSKIYPILKYALELCQSKDKGGRIMETDDHSGAILDCSCWPDDYSHALLARYPSCSIAFISAQDISATGFSVFLSIEKGSFFSYWSKGIGGKYTKSSFLMLPLPMPGMMVLGCMVLMVVDMVSMLSK
jgi:hypothetical protein